MTSIWSIATGLFGGIKAVLLDIADGIALAPEWAWWLVGASTTILILWSTPC